VEVMVLSKPRLLSQGRSVEQAFSTALESGIYVAWLAVQL